MKEAEAVKPKKGKRGLLIAILVVFTLVIGGLASFAITSGKAAEMVEAIGSKEETTVVPFEEFLINLEKGEANKDRYLKIELSLASTEKDAEELLTASGAQVRDAVISVLRKKTPESAFAEEEGALVIKKELKEKINQALGAEIVNDIFVTNMVMQ